MQGASHARATATHVDNLCIGVHAGVGHDALHGSRRHTRAPHAPRSWGAPPPPRHGKDATPLLDPCRVRPPLCSPAPLVDSRSQMQQSLTACRSSHHAFRNSAVCTSLPLWNSGGANTTRGSRISSRERSPAAAKSFEAHTVMGRFLTLFSFLWRNCHPHMRLCE